MNRNRILTALVLRVRPFGENAREGFFLTREDGILRAAVYGGAKSKLRAYVSPFNSGVLYLYHDPVRDTNKVTDFDCLNWRPGLREMYERTITADEIAKTILTGLGGSFDEALQMAEESLNALENASLTRIRPILIHFWWRWANILGIRPGFHDLQEGFNPGHRPPLGEGATRWLTATATLSPAQTARFTMDAQSEYEAAAFCHALLR
ncbi:MAG: recombination protein O N-terminal domain-containing protein [Spirochaetaceae bacterium]|nr:recombination protein O N-terminal domain-containing protein [Spirochaetaceae bacterium]